MSTTATLVAVPLTTPPTRQALGGKAGDGWFAREKFVDGVGNLNLAVQQLQTVVGLQTSTTTAVTGLLALVNGNLSFGDIADGKPAGNLLSILLTGTSPATPNTPFTLTHNLGKIPNGFNVGQKSAASDFYGTATAQSWTTTDLTILCDTASIDFVILVY